MSKRRLPGATKIDIGGVGYRNICKVYVTLDSIAVPLEHASDGFLQLGTAVLLDATCINPKVFQTISNSLGAAEQHLFVAVGLQTGHIGTFLVHVLESHLFGVILQPSMRKNCILWLAVMIWNVDQLDGSIAQMEKPHLEQILPMSRRGDKDKATRTSYKKGS